MYDLIVGQIYLFLYSLSFWLVRLFIVLVTISNHWNDSPDSELNISFDYIIVGSGTAGTVIFSEMSPDMNVLMVEAGSENGFKVLDIPILSPALQRSQFDWSYLTVPQQNACFAMKDRKCLLAAGRGYGGSNILNNMIYYRGHPNDFRGWFKEVKDYNYEMDIVPLFREMEHDFFITDIKHTTSFGQAFTKFDITKDNAGNVTFSTPQVLQRNGFRWSAAHALRLKQHSERHKIVYNTQAMKFVFDHEKKGHIIGLNVRKNNRIFKLRAKKGYILTSGAIGTPKLLLHSGVGPCEKLANNFIPCVVNISGVGKNLQDHIATGFDLVTLNTSLNLGLMDILNPKTAYNFFFQAGRSQWSTVGCEALGFHRHSTSTSNDTEQPVLGFMVLPMGLSSDGGSFLRDNLHIADSIWNNYFRHLKVQQTVSILPIVLQPKSRGYITLASPDVDTPPIVNPRYLSHPDDMKTLIKGINIIKNNFLTHPSLQALNARMTPRLLPECETFQFYTDAYWECYVKHISFSVYHLGGTCRIGDPIDEDTVVDRTNFRVKGVDNLYIADASIMPNLPSGNSNAAVMLIAKQFMRVLLKDTVEEKTDAAESFETSSISGNRHQEKESTQPDKIEL